MKHIKWGVGKCHSSDKTCYAREVDVLGAASRAMRRRKVLLTYYLCKSCNTYHLTRIKTGRKPDESLPS